MALFKKTEEAASKVTGATEVKRRAKAPVVKKKVKASEDKGAQLTKTPVRILKAPRITEKAALMTVGNAYVLEVAQDATKNDVAKTVHVLYGVKPRKVNMVRKQPRAYVARMRNRKGTKAGMKKAYVFLHKGDKIDLM